MALKAQLTEDMKAALKGRDQFKLDTLRMVISAVKNKEIEKKGELPDDVITTLIGTLVKQRKEAAQLYRQGGRDDLAGKEEQEIDILKVYLPEQMSEEALGKVVEAVIGETGASSMADMGKVMKGVMARVAGKADGSLVSAIVKKNLA
ncbi:MAG: GatB/YqeY domain-containing protein [Deltaproteobacteria bacterium]|nr:GatB/YqeY domain-containing protein [Deltaproteobacteria bacterium]